MGERKVYPGPRGDERSALNGLIMEQRIEIARLRELVLAFLTTGPTAIAKRVIDNDHRKLRKCDLPS